MTVKDIQRALLYKFNSHKYELCNSYVFNWECDFFSITDAGYAYEVEIKLSRGDFFADFKKEKHRIFNLVSNGKSFYWENAGKSWEGADLGRVKYKQLVRSGRPIGKNYEPLEDGITYDFKTGLYTSNQWQGYYLAEKTLSLQAPATRIRFVDLAKKHLPHRFFYACPANLIKKEEVPPYAGLIYIDGFSAEIIKNAPFLHKRDMNLKGILLEKFYYECRRLRDNQKESAV